MMKIKSSKKIITSLILPLTVLALSGCGEKKKEPIKQPYCLEASNNIQDATINSLVSTDALGRSFGESISANSDRLVGMFYFVWHGEHTAEILDVTKESSENPDFWKSFSGQGDKRSEIPNYDKFYYFDEPLYGYYCSDDPWVITRHVELLTMSGVDYISLDLTNWSIYEKNITAVLEVLLKFQQQGWKVPKVTSILNGTDPNAEHHNRIKMFYDIFYSNPRYDSLWLRDRDSGKPVITISIDTYLEKLVDYVRYNLEFRNTIWPFDYGKQSEYNDLSWMDWNYPQTNYQNKSGNSMSVSVTQHVAGSFGLSANPNTKEYFYNINRGRGYDYEKKKNDPNKILEGSNFESQWGNAHKDRDTLDEVFVTGWNEWIAYKLTGDDLNTANYVKRYFPELADLDPNIYNNAIDFCDTCNDEFSRDLEMTKNGYGDNFYLQNMRNTRLFKDNLGATYYGAYASQFLKDNVWENSRTYLDFVGEAIERDFPSTDKSFNYVNKTNRNDIKEVKVSNDDNYLYLKVNTANLIEIDETKDNNLNILLSINGKDTPRWEGYNYILNRKALTKGVGKTNLEKVSANGKYEFAPVSECDYFMGNDYLNIKIPLNDLGIESGEQFTIDLKVADGISEPYNIMDYYIDGDSAPIGRLNYRYNSYHK